MPNFTTRLPLAACCRGQCMTWNGGVYWQTIPPRGRGRVTRFVLFDCPLRCEADRIFLFPIPADLLRTRLVRRLLLAFFVAYDALIDTTCSMSGIWLRHTGLPAVLASHVLRAFKVILFRHPAFS